MHDINVDRAEAITIEWLFVTAADISMMVVQCIRAKWL